MSSGPSTTMIRPAEARRRRYPFVVLPDETEDDGYSIVFPDLPGVTSWSPTLEEIPHNVREVLELEFDGSEEDGWLVPAPSPYPDDDTIHIHQMQSPGVPDPNALKSAREVGDHLGISSQAVNAAARKLGLGRIIGEQRLFSPADVQALTARPGRGRPRRDTQPDEHPRKTA